MTTSEIGADRERTIDGIAELYDAVKGLAYGLAFQILRERTAAEDAVQDAFLSVWRSRDAYDSRRGPLKSWILTIVRNRAIDRLRRDRANPVGLVNLDAAPDVTDDDGADPTARGAERVWVREALRALPDAQREAILLAYFAGYSHTQIAKRSGLPLGTVKGQLRLGLRKLAAELASPRTIVRGHPWRAGKSTTF